MAEQPDPHPQRRSSSQTSSASNRSAKARTLRSKAQKRHSGSNTRTDLTSFPSLPPSSPPDNTPTLTRGLTTTLLTGDTGDGPNETGRGRKATLARLTTGVSLMPPAAPPYSMIRFRLVIFQALCTSQTMRISNIVRQFARDLAQRDAEISALRQRADARERELKKMLREVSVSNQDIERRLYQMENNPEDRTSDGDSTHSLGQASQSSGLDGLMSQAMTDAVGSNDGDTSEHNSDLQATLRPQRTDELRDAEGNRKRQGSLRGWQEYIFGSTNPSRKTSRASSIMSDMQESQAILLSGGKLSTSSSSIPPNGKPGSISSDTLGRRIASGSTNGDDASVHSRKSSRSLGSWTVKLFAGNSPGPKDSSDSESSRKISNSQDKNTDSKSSLSAIAALKRINSNTNIPGSLGRSASSNSGTVRINPATRRTPISNISQVTAAAENSDRISTNLGPVEMDAILPMESRPPTLAPIYNNSQSGEFLTDRFGFIYDQRRKKRQREANASKTSKHRLSITETLGNLRSDSDVEDENQNLPSATPETPSSPPDSPVDPESGTAGLRRWQDYLRMPTRPTELLSHTPSTAPIVSLTTAEQSRFHSSSVSVDKDGTLSLNSGQPSASTSAITADRPEFAGISSEEQPAIRINASETEPVKLLLEQLTDLHDTLQRDRTVRWNEFLRKVRAERRKEGEAAAAAASSSDKSVTAVDTPEAILADGEVIGISGLGNKGKVGRAKWREFRALVLGGIPVALRAKVWSECSGASGMRIPGYYEDLVRGVGGTEPDPSVIAQIEMDIRRTLTDNVFFRKGPGVAKLKEVLLAYSRRNSEVGYCQGMNLIAASLLLIMPTAEDAFWILTSMIEIILPQHYYDHGLMASRADQAVLRQYITELLPKLSVHLEELGIELEALTFQWFLSLFTDCLSAEALYRVWDVVLCLNVTSTAQNGATPSASAASSIKEGDKATPTLEDPTSGGGGGSTFLFQVALALLKLNEPQLLTTCSTPAALYTYINHQMTNHAISIDGLIQASEALRNMVRREDVVSRRAVALREMREFG
ncbi:hypothetical protein N7509_011361 [Penicillium cosmopolitanum]|uniref:Rab-GAP TBC domain-containing protein n=1 Tax=Penicillium cosmopolitanum TaxID=1131564 RepID=A0A9X0B5F8_9EURO|nr:uncharacterized protein N7509_011361 [Penicillium cosmopolitanum]KAJ5388820.1 hypothetical protein N7509_011361 [Penicillium cosmopolitanum]